MGILTGGIVLAVIGLIMWVIKGKKEGQSAQLELTDTSKIAEVEENYSSIQGSM